MLKALPPAQPPFDPEKDIPVESSTWTTADWLDIMKGLIEFLRIAEAHPKVVDSVFLCFLDALTWPYALVRHGLHGLWERMVYPIQQIVKLRSEARKAKQAAELAKMGVTNDQD